MSVLLQFSPITANSASQDYSLYLRMHVPQIEWATVAPRVAGSNPIAHPNYPTKSIWTGPSTWRDRAFGFTPNALDWPVS
jgi:hypothetical protein